ncbi:MAG: hypothetical protein QXL27_06135 [Candidatus Bathyarchaeia archaeon]
MICVMPSYSVYTALTYSILNNGVFQASHLNDASINSEAENLFNSSLKIP